MRTVVFGAGYWGKNYIRELIGNLVAVIDPDLNALERVRSTYNIDTYTKLPDGLEFDAAVIATPPMSHVELALPLLKDGKAVLIEKPLATSVQEAERLLPYAEQVMAAHVYMYHPVVEKMRTWCKSFAIDHAFSQRTNHGPIRPWQNALWDLASHDVSIFNYLFGPAQYVTSFGTRHWAALRVNYGSLDAVTYVSWLGGPKVRRIELITDQQHSERYVFDDLQWVLEVSPLRKMLDAFMSGNWDRCRLHDGIDVIKVLEAA